MGPRLTSRPSSQPELVSFPDKVPPLQMSFPPRPLQHLHRKKKPSFPIRKRKFPNREELTYVRASQNLLDLTSLMLGMRAHRQLRFLSGVSHIEEPRETI